MLFNMKKKLLGMFYLLFCLGMTVAADARSQAKGLESLERQPALLPGLPDLTKNVYLSKDSLACVSRYEIVGTSKAFPQRIEDPQIVAALRSSGCAFSDKEMRVVVELPDASSELYLSEKYAQYVGIFWRNPSGQIWRGYTMISNLHN
jgi:hypothetical protein